VRVIDRVRTEITELQGRWEALGEELEATRRSLRLAEATLERMQLPLVLATQEEVMVEEEEGAQGCVVLCVGDEELMSQAGQASVVYNLSPSEANVQSVT
jgi:hypothetical protein